MSLPGQLYEYLTNHLGIPNETVYGLALFGVLIGLYWILSSREVEILVERVTKKPEPD